MMNLTLLVNLICLALAGTSEQSIQDCLDGPFGVSPIGQCATFDIDADNDIDLFDYAVFSATIKPASSSFYSNQKWSRRYGIDATDSAGGVALGNEPGKAIAHIMEIPGFHVYRGKTLRWKEAKFLYRRQEDVVSARLFLATRKAGIWTPRISYDWLGEFQAQPAGLDATVTLDMSALMSDTERTLILTGDEDGVGWGIFADSSTADAATITTRTTSGEAGNSNGLSPAFHFVDDIEHGSTSPETYDQSTASLEAYRNTWIQGRVILEEDKDRSPIKLDDPYDGTESKTFVLPHDDTDAPYSILLKGVTTPGSGNVVIRLLKPFDNADPTIDTTLAYINLDVTNGVMKFDSSDSNPGSVEFVADQDYALLDLLICVKSATTAELLWIARKFGKAEGPKGDGDTPSTRYSSDYVWRAHASTVAHRHKSHISMAERPTHLMLEAAPGFAATEIWVGRPVWIIGDSQSIYNTPFQQQQRLSEFLNNHLPFPQGWCLVGSSGASLTLDNPVHTAVYQKVQHTSSVGMGSAISGMFNCDVLIAGIGVNDVANNVFNETQLDSLKSTYTTRLTGITDSVFANSGDNAVWYLALPTWPGADPPIEETAVYDIGRIILEQAALNGSPGYDPYGWTFEDPSRVNQGNLHYNSASANFVISRMVDAIVGGYYALNDDPGS